MEVLEIFIGLFFIYLLISLFASIVQEILSSLLSMRGRVLAKALAKLIGIEDIKDQYLFEKYLRRHVKSYRKLISSNLFVKRIPSYLSHSQVTSIIQEFLQKKDFDKASSPKERLNEKVNNRLGEIISIDFFDARWLYYGFINIKELLFALLEYLWQSIAQWVLGEKDTHKDIYDKIKDLVDPATVNDLRLKNIFKGLNYELENQANKTEDIAAAKKVLAENFDEMMDRAQGWYKRRVQVILILIGFISAFYLNADTIEIYKKLARNPNARIALANQAQDFVSNNEIKQFYKSEGDTTKLDTLIRSLTNLYSVHLDTAFSTLDLGWNLDTCSHRKVRHSSVLSYPLCLTSTIYSNINESDNAGMKWVGFVLTALAVSLGATFWFDLLKLLLNIRNAGNRPTPVPTKEE